MNFGVTSGGYLRSLAREGRIGISGAIKCLHVEIDHVFLLQIRYADCKDGSEYFSSADDFASVPLPGFVISCVAILLLTSVALSILGCVTDSFTKAVVAIFLHLNVAL